jgi:hypothetical protein
MEDARLRQEILCQPLDPLPRRLVALAASPQRPLPEPDHAVAEGLESTDVGQHRVIGKIPGDHLSQPLPLSGNRLMHPPPQFVLHRQELRLQPIAPGFPP